MRKPFPERVEKARINPPHMPNYHTKPGDRYGLFELQRKGKHFFVMAVENGKGWDHVSVSPVRQKHPPTWGDMCWIKDLFFEDSEVVVQFHPTKAEYVNIVETCLHLWRPVYNEMPMPPLTCV